MKLCIIGANGRMGQAIIESAQQQNINIHSVVVKECTDYVGHKLSKEVKILHKVEDGADIIIDFSNSQASKSNVEYANKYQIPILIGTTEGHKKSDYNKFNIPIMWAPNTSITWNIMENAIEKISLASKLAIQIGEVHHKNKKDDPSGTTKQLDDKINADKVWSLRVGKNMSMHQFMGINDLEIARLEHQVLDRQLYAHDALVICKWLIMQKNQLFIMQDFINEII
ncbi:4-hydroxy-tetrahydrodipicolinate reductase [Candidatus Cytomitobacter indipagum]|nr:dihydrodipicolinate reductase C-terminal domain-containing protein [Candidatus Cytomitobacter indipagum]